MTILEGEENFYLVVGDKSLYTRQRQFERENEEKEAVEKTLTEGIMHLDLDGKVINKKKNDKETKKEDKKPQNKESEPEVLEFFTNKKEKDLSSENSKTEENSKKTEEAKPTEDLLDLLFDFTKPLEESQVIQNESRPSQEPLSNVTHKINEPQGLPSNNMKQAKPITS